MKLFCVLENSFFKVWLRIKRYNVGLNWDNGKLDEISCILNVWMAISYTGSFMLLDISLMILWTRPMNLQECAIKSLYDNNIIKSIMY